MPLRDDGTRPVMDEVSYLEDFDSGLDAERERQAVWDLVAQLPKRERVVVILSHLDGLSLAEIGRMYGVTESRISRIRSRAYERMRRWATAA
jgi:RNA polymerase sigma factor (sigma-70 family)